MTVRVGINGFGRIGRNFFRAAKASGADIDFVAVNDLGSIETMAHLLKYDSVLGRFPEKITANKSSIKVGGDTLQVLSERNPADLPWGDLGVDVVVESTGFFNSREKASAHLDGGAPLVIVSAPASNADATFVYGVNHKDFKFAQHKVISNASCTTNCFVPMVKVLDDAFGVEQGLMTTVHSYTGDQSLVDGPHSDLRRARGCGDQHRADLHRRRPCDVARHAVDEGQARRHRTARAHADRLAHRLHGQPEEGCERSRRSTQRSKRRARRR
jgi:glyceraldehyde 3-phosphate dehydrogenase